jgi:RNA polymerase sigma-70 factor (ECF subfamily)
VKAEEKNMRFLALIEENKGILLRICLFYTRTEPDRQDLFQEIVLQAWKTYPAFRHESKFSTWLYRVSLNTALAARRKEKNLIIQPYENMTVRGLQEDENEPLEKMYSAIESLNEIEKSIVLLYLDAYSYEDMEEILGISCGALRVKMSRIKQKLKTIIK